MREDPREQGRLLLTPTEKRRAHRLGPQQRGRCGVAGPSDPDQVSSAPSLGVHCVGCVLGGASLSPSLPRPPRFLGQPPPGRLHVGCSHCGRARETALLTTARGAPYLDGGLVPGIPRLMTGEASGPETVALSPGRNVRPPSFPDFDGQGNSSLTACGNVLPHTGRKSH